MKYYLAPDSATKKQITLYQEILNIALKCACLNAPLLSGGDQGLAYYYCVVLEAINTVIQVKEKKR